MPKKKVNVMVTAFRDGFQSVFGARVFTKDFMPAVEACRAAGINHYEAGGGARFQSLYFYCNEDAFAMMDEFREKAGPDANLQTLARGVNVVGLESQPSDVIKLHAQLFKKHGITTIRNFDALNDVNNLVYSGKCIKEAGLNHEVVVSMMALPPGIVSKAHTPEFYVGILRKILNAGIPYDSVCYKDASGTSTPATVHETMKQSRALLGPKTKLVFHTHDTAGTGTACYMAALDGGADSIDLSLAPVSGGTCQPDVLSMWHALRGSDYEFPYDFEKIREAEEVFKECMKDYFMPPEAKAVEPLIPMSPMPGGALTANTQMMRDNNLMERYPEVLVAMREVVEKGGFGTSVTPVSQFYFQQAFNNVMLGPWEKFADGYGKMVLGYFGKTPTPPDPEIVKLAAEKMKLEPTTKTVLELNDADPTKGTAVAKKMLEAEGLPITDENVFIAATCKEKGIYFLKGEGLIGVRKIGADAPAAGGGAGGGGPYAVTVNQTKYTVVLEGGTAKINGKSYKVDVSSGAAAAAAPAASGDGTLISAPLPGGVLKINVAVGDSVNPGDVLLVLEAMKMETPIKTKTAGTVQAILVNRGEQVTSGQGLVELG